MALISGDFDNIGDIFVLQLGSVSQVVSFNFFQDGITGETGTRFFKKEFRYSNDTINFTAWADLTDPNLQAITTNLLDPFFFEIRYTRDGTDATGTLTWDFFYLDVTVDPLATNTFYPTIFTSDNVFGSFKTDNIDFVALCGNLLEKTIKYGIIPKHFSDENEERTEDYIHFWKTVCCWFSLHFILAKQFADIFDTQELLAELLRQRGLFLCGSEDLSVLQTLSQNYYDEVRKRGTAQVIPEIKRVLCNSDCDELIFTLANNYEIGWTLNNSSPLYRGAQGIRALNKMTEKGPKVLDLANYHTLGSVSLGADVSNSAGVNAIVTDSTDVDTGFTIVTTTQGAPPLTPELSKVTCIADVSGNLAGKHWLFSTPLSDYYVWYSVFGVDSIDPDLSSISVKVSIQPNDTAIVVAEKTETALGFVEELFTDRTGAILDISNEDVCVMQITNNTGSEGIQQSGIGNDHLMIVDPQLNYGLSVFVKQTTLAANLTFGIQLYDCDKNPISAINLETGASSNSFFDSSGVINNNGKYIQLRGILFNKDEALRSAIDATLSIGDGRHLKMPINAVYAYPIIKVVNPAPQVTDTRLYDVKFGLNDLPYSTGILGLTNFIISFMKNENPDLSQSQINDLINKFLIPANSAIQTVQL